MAPSATGNADEVGCGRIRPKTPLPAEAVATRLLDWYGEQGRDLPWRQSRDPYRVWLSEIMLQQTTVAAVIPYYQRFLERFPTLQNLADAPLEDVIQLWAGLGYYSRARNLHRAARQVMDQFAGEFPATLDDLVSLPGVGRSTAGAILSIAFGQPAPILDGNVRRVLVRLFAWREDPRSSRADRQLWQWAELLTPGERADDYAQAVMDLGAMICVPRQPLCDRCPLHDLCLACQQGLTGELPFKRPKRTIPLRRQVTLLVCRQGRMWVVRRPPSGLLGGLWEFPVVEVGEETQPARQVRLLQEASGLSGEPAFLGTIRHAYSHFKLELAVYFLNLEELTLVAENDRRWCPIDDLGELPLHGAHVKALALCREQRPEE